MRKQAGWSIRTKLVLLGLVSSGVAVALACAGFVFFEVWTLRQTKSAQLQAQAKMLAFNCTGALTFQDREAGRQLLTSLTAQPDVEVICLYNAKGQLLAGCGDEARLAAMGESTPAENHLSESWAEVEILQPVVDGRETVGTLYVRARLADLATQFSQYARIVALVMCLAMGASIVLSARMAQRISDPLRRLAETARRISVQHDYSLRSNVKSDGELGQLCSAFNDMLTRIEFSKAAIRRSQDSLEERVEERTSQLLEEVSRRATIQRDLERAKAAAEEANKAKSRFLANMSHEIRTPLNGILGFTSLLLRNAATDEAERRDFLNTIHASGQHLLGLINDILDLSKIEAGQFTVERVVCPTQPLIAEVLGVLRVRSQEKGLRLTHRWNSRLPETIQTDPYRLRQLLINLIGNAVKFTERGVVEVVSRLDDAGPQSRLVFEIIDTGIGIPADKLQDIFKPFVQADASVTRRFGGTGLGLAICRKLAKALGGTIEVHSELGKGSTFTLTVETGSLQDVELLAPAQGDTLHTAAPALTPSAEQINLSGVSILLAEDGETNRKLFDLVLRRAGAAVKVAENGRIAVESALSQPFDAIVMDMQMPELDGYSASRALRTAGLTTPIIALTAHAMKGDEEKCREAGCSGYLTKPIDPDLLLRTLAESIGAHGQAASVGAPPRAVVPAKQERIISALDTTDPEFRDLVASFLGGLSEAAAKMRHAWESGDRPAFARLLHSVKGTGGSVGFPAFSALAARIEKSVRQRDCNEVDRLLEDFGRLAQCAVRDNAGWLHEHRQKSTNPTVTVS